LRLSAAILEAGSHAASLSEPVWTALAARIAS
jgi:hypothetical protein